MRSLHEFYIQIAKLTADLSYCNRLKVGAVIVKDNNILSFGYNGTPTGHDNCCEQNNVTNPLVLHAESNAIMKCVKSGLSTNNAILYTTHSPCIECSKLIVQSGIKEVYYVNEYRSLDGIDFLNLSNIKIRQK